MSFHTLWRASRTKIQLLLRKHYARAHGKQLVHLLHIGKTGGTALKTVFSECPETDRCVLFLWRHTTTLRHIPRGEKVIFVTRDPISRFVSGFYSRQRQGRPRHNMPWSDGEKVAFEHFATANELALALSSSDPTRKERARTAMNAIFHVNSSYWDWFGDEEYFKSRIGDILFVGRQETLTSDFEILKAKLRLPDHVRIPTDDVAAHRTPVGFDRRLDEDAENILREWYHREYDFLELCRRVLVPENAPSFAEMPAFTNSQFRSEQPVFCEFCSGPVPHIGACGCI